MSEGSSATSRNSSGFAWLWGLGALVLFFGFLFIIRGALLPFLLGLAIAYLMDPLADRFQRWGAPRWLATLVSLLLFFGLLVTLLLIAVPIFLEQARSLIEVLPDFVVQIQPYLQKVMKKAGGFAQVETVLGQAGSTAAQWVSTRIGELIAGGMAFINLVSLLLVAPVVAFYLLRDWDVMNSRLIGWIPQEYERSTRGFLSDANQALAGFARGQLIVCLAMAALYASGWALLGLKYGGILGLFTGLMGFFPVVGPLFGGLLAVLVALGQWGLDPLHVGLVVGVMMVVQVVEGSFLTPKFVGDRVKLHPVWVLFAIFSGGELMGLTGIFLAVPIAALIAVVVRRAPKRALARQFLSALPRLDPRLEQRPDVLAEKPEAS